MKAFLLIAIFLAVANVTPSFARQSIDVSNGKVVVDNSVPGSSVQYKITMAGQKIQVEQNKAGGKPIFVEVVDNEYDLTQYTDTNVSFNINIPHFKGTLKLESMKIHQSGKPGTGGDIEFI